MGCIISYVKEIFSRNKLSDFKLIFCLSFLVSGCLVSAPASTHFDTSFCDDLPAMGNGGRISVFLNLSRPDVPHLKVNISSVEILVGGRWLIVAERPKEIDTREIGDGQIFLGRRVLPAGDYSRMRLTVSRAAVVNQGKESALTVELPDLEITLSSPLTLAMDDSKTILLEWDVDGAISGFSLKPLSVSASFVSVAPLTTNLLYVACPEINTVYVIRTDKNMVVSSIPVPGRPAYLSIDSIAKKLFVLAVDESQIKVFDLVSYRMIDNIKLPMTIRPEFMAISPDARNAYVIDSRSNLLLMDLQSGNMIARKRVGQKAEFICYLPLLQKLAVSSQVDQTVYLLNKDDLTIEETIKVASTPRGLLEYEDYLYIAEEMVDTVAVYDLVNRIMVKRVPVGYSPKRMVAERNSVFVANYDDASVSVIKGGQFHVIQVIPLQGKVREMAVADQQRLLFVGTGDCEGALAVVDLASNRMIGMIELGTRPLGIAASQ